MKNNKFDHFLDSQIKKELTPVNIDQAYDDYLTTLYGTFFVGLLKFPASQIFEKCQPILYKTEKVHFIKRDGYYKLNGNYYDRREVYDLTVDAKLNFAPREL